MRWQGRRESDNVEDRRGQSSDLGAGGGFRVPVGGKGGIAILAVVLVAGTTASTYRRCSTAEMGLRTASRKAPISARKTMN